MKLVFTCGVFDLLHEGHLKLFEKMIEYADGGLTLAVLHDGFTTFKNKKKLPIENLEKRTRNIIDTGMIDIIRYTFEEFPNETFTKIIYDYINRFDLTFMRGNDWEIFPGHQTLIDRDIPIIYTQYTSDITSTFLKANLRNRI